MDDLLLSVFRNQWVLFLIVGLVVTALAELGFRLGLRLYAAKDEARTSQIGGIQGAVLGLLGLLLGFTFAMAVGRYEARRDLVVKEANAIGTTFLRAALLPQAHTAPVEELLRRYVEVRLKYQALADDPAKLAEGMRLSADIQRELWRHAVEASRESPTAIVASFVNALNETIDTDADRVAASRNRIPGSVWLLLLIVASLGCLTSSYAAGAHGRRSAFSTVALPLLITIAMTLIFDLANPRQGFIGVSQRPLVELQQAIEPASR